VIEELFARYAQRLARFADQHLSKRVGARLDGEDVVQSVFRTFFRRYSRGELRVDSSAEVWRLLVRITLRKVQAKGRHHTAGPRDVGADLAGGDSALTEAMAREPGPEEAAMLVDEIESLLRGLPELHCRILDLRLQGHGVAEIAAQLGTSRMTVYRALNLLQQRLEAGPRQTLYEVFANIPRDKNGRQRNREGGGKRNGMPGPRKRHLERLSCRTPNSIWRRCPPPNARSWSPGWRTSTWPGTKTSLPAGRTSFRAAIGCACRP
jgi:RNA polymerase sigma-70 factor (ECF subfamily)